MTDPTPHTLTLELAVDVKSLAVRYDAYNCAVAASDWESAAMWGEMLRDVQDVLGVTLIGADRLAGVIAFAADLRGRLAVAS